MPINNNTYMINYYKENRNRMLTYARNVQRPKLQLLRKNAINLLGTKCCKCGFQDARALHIDHIHGGGCLEQKRFGTGAAYLKNVCQSVMDNENKYQLLCANCNWIKKIENKEHSGANKKLERKYTEKTLFD